MSDKKCRYCQSEDNNFVTLNETVDYSGIEMALNRQGMLRVRYSDYPDDLPWESEDILNVNFCPICGRKL